MGSCRSPDERKWGVVKQGRAEETGIRCFEPDIRCFEPELHRLEGELVLASNEPNENRAEASLRRISAFSEDAAWPVDGDPALGWKGSASSEKTMTAETPIPARQRDPWNKGRMIGQKRPLKPKDVWTIRVRLQLESRKRDLAMFNLAIDSKLRGCDLVRLRVDDVLAGGSVRDRATVVQKKTGRPVQFEITEQARSAIGDWLAAFDTHRSRDLFPSRFRQQPHFSTRQYARIVHRWVERAGLDSSAYGTHSLRRTKNLQEDR